VGFFILILVGSKRKGERKENEEVEKKIEMTHAGDLGKNALSTSCAFMWFFPG